MIPADDLEAGDEAMRFLGATFGNKKKERVASKELASKGSCFLPKRASGCTETPPSL